MTSAKEDNLMIQLREKGLCRRLGRRIVRKDAAFTAADTAGRRQLSWAQPRSSARYGRRTKGGHLKAEQRGADDACPYYFLTAYA